MHFNFFILISFWVLFIKKSVFKNVIVSASGVSKADLPGPCPTSPDEKAAAAKKYSMTVEDYEPYPDKGEG